VIGQGDVPKVYSCCCSIPIFKRLIPHQAVHQYISQEYARACLISYEALPTVAFHEGWGRPGTKYSGLRFRRALLDTIQEIGTCRPFQLSPYVLTDSSSDALAHLIIPSHPILRPHSRMLHHFRFILPLLPQDEDGISLLHYYDSAIQLARNSTKEPTEMEFQIAMESAAGIKKM
jgi:hypothetical protein